MPYVPNVADPTQPVDTVDRSTAAAEFRALKLYLQNLITSFVPIQSFTGEIKIWSGKLASVPAGWLLLGTGPTTVSRAAYPNLHAFMQSNGYPYGNGDGATTFNIPYIEAGLAIIGCWGDDFVGTRSVGQMPSHLHTYGATAETGGVGYGPGVPVGGGIAHTSTAGAGIDNLAAGIRFYHIIKT